MLGDGDSIYGTKYGPAVTKPSDCARVSLCDVQDDRILKYLDDAVKEEHFKEMASWGVKLLRVPTGYWNWVTLDDKVTPNGPSREAGRFANL
jgi:hypothetical protein